MIRIARIAFALLALTAIGRQLTLHIVAAYSGLNFFSYFTNLSNLFAALVLLLSAFPGRRGTNDLLRYVSTVNMTVVGIVFAVLLRNVDLGALLPWVNYVLHDVMPVAVVLDWLVSPPVSTVRSKHIASTLAFPAAYLVYSLLRGASTGWYPYPFLNPGMVGGYGMVCLYALGIALTFVFAAWALRALGNRRARR